MEDLLFIEEVEINLTITEDEINCDHGNLEFSFDGDTAIINSISVYMKRNRIGTKLVNQLEILARKNKLSIIEVPASPTKEAILFWESLGFIPFSKEDTYWANKITRSSKESSWDTSSGIVVMTKKIGTEKIIIDFHL